MAPPSVTFFGPLDTILGNFMAYVLLVLVIFNIVTRLLAHKSHVKQAEEGGIQTHSWRIIERIKQLLLPLWNIIRGNVDVDEQDDEQKQTQGAEAIKRHPLHVVSNVLLILGSFYYLTLHHHAGMVASTLVLGLFLTDFFEFEARKVEARSSEFSLERPKGAIAASILVLMYVSYLSLFFLIKPIWSNIV